MTPPVIYYCSDLHWGHASVAKLRGYAVESWKALVIDELSALRPNDILFILGDVALDKKSTAEAFDMLESLPVHDIRLVWGNHDQGRPTSSHPNKALHRRACEVTTVTGTALSRKIAGRQVLLSHFPYDSVPSQYATGDEPNLANRLFRLHDQGLPLVHGHVHSGPIHLLPYTMNVAYEATGHLLTTETEIEAWVNKLTS